MTRELSPAGSVEHRPVLIDRHRGVTAAAGFRAAGVAAGIKDSGLDVTVVINDGPGVTAAGVFTTNQVAAAPVRWSRRVLSRRRVRAVVLNSGGANACTGPDGDTDTLVTAERLAALLGRDAGEIAVCSTGLIGERLPMTRLLAGVERAVAEAGTTPAADLAAATAVMTTDSVPKRATARHPDGWTIGGFAKGSGMCAPNMATMLSVLTTDAIVDTEDLDRHLRAAAGLTWNRLTVDAGTSTNDTVLLMASGASGVRADAASFAEALVRVCADLVDQVQADAEGATKAITITVRGAVSHDEALALARVVAEDPLVKTAMYGSDPNWGRIAMAAGRGPAKVDPTALDIALNGVTVCRAGAPVGDRRRVDLSGRAISVEIGLGLGAGGATVRTTDLSTGYVEENSAYSS